MASLPWYVWGLLVAGAALLVGGAAKAAPPAGGAVPAPKPAGSPPLLKKGSSGPWVSYLQSILGVQQTATFDAATEASVKAYQQAKGLDVDGVVGKDTWGSLGVQYNSPAGSSPKAPSGGGGGGTTAATPPADSFSLPPSPPAASASGGGVLSDDIATREAQILAEVNAGNIDHGWKSLSWQKNGHTVSVKVSRRALALTGTWSSSKGNSTTRLIPSVSFNTAQKIADSLGAVMLTTKVADEADTQADLRLPAWAKFWQGPGSDETGSKTFRMIEQSNWIESKALGHGGLVSNEGKDWVLTCRWWSSAEPAWKRHNSANFGGYPGTLKSPGGKSVVQSVGLTHDRFPFVDYSQLVRLMLPTVLIDGVPHDIAEVLADPNLAPLISDEACTMPKPRHPDL